MTAALLEKHRLERLGVLLALEGVLTAALIACGVLRAGSFVKLFAPPAAAAVPFCLLALVHPGRALVPVAVGMAISSKGVVLAVGLLLAALAASGAVALVAATTSASEARRALRALGVPEGALAVVTFAARQIAAVGAEAERLRRASVLRGAQPRGALAFAGARGRLTRLFSGVLARASRVDRCLAARGFTGVVPDPPLTRLRAGDVAAVILGLATCAAVRFIP